MMVVVALQFDPAKKGLHVEHTPAMAFFRGASRLLIWKKFRVGKKPPEQAAGVPVQGLPQFFFEPLRASAQTLLARQTLAG
jgi:hypothetical protein